MSKKLRLLLIGIASVGLVVGTVLFLVGTFKPKSAGLFIETVPKASVFIDGEQVGRTPYETTRSPGEVTIKLIPESIDTALAPFETKLTLASEIDSCFWNKNCC
jgi:hypothetical protein